MFFTSTIPRYLMFNHGMILQFRSEISFWIYFDQMMMKYFTQYKGPGFILADPCDFINPLRENLSRGKIKCIYHLYHFSHWYDTDSWNPSSCQTRIYLFYTVDITDADVLAMQGAWVSVTMILSMSNRNNSVPERFNKINAPYSSWTLKYMVLFPDTSHIKPRLKRDSCTQI